MKETTSKGVGEVFMRESYTLPVKEDVGREDKET
jgi:hypothetical protein